MPKRAGGGRESGRVECVGRNRGGDTEPERRQRGAGSGPRPRTHLVVRAPRMEDARGSMGDAPGTLPSSDDSSEELSSALQLSKGMSIFLDVSAAGREWGRRSPARFLARSTARAASYFAPGPTRPRCRGDHPPKSESSVSRQPGCRRGRDSSTVPTRVWKEGGGAAATRLSGAGLAAGPPGSTSPHVGFPAAGLRLRRLSSARSWFSLCPRRVPGRDRLHHARRLPPWPCPRSLPLCGRDGSPILSSPSPAGFLPSRCAFYL